MRGARRGPGTPSVGVRGAPAPGQWRRGVSHTYGETPDADLGDGACFEVPREHCLDRRRARTPGDPVDGARAAEFGLEVIHRLEQG